MGLKSWAKKKVKQAGRVTAAVATGGMSEAAIGAYEKMYKEPAEAQKKAADQGVDLLAKLRDKNSSRLAASKGRALAPYGSASSAIGNYVRDKPTQLDDLYKRTSAAGPRTSALTTLRSGPGYRSPLTDLYASGSVGAGATEAQSRYANRGDREATASTSLDAFSKKLGENFAGASLRQRITNRGNTTDPLSTYFADRKREGAGPIYSLDQIGKTGTESRQLAKDASGYVDQFDAGARMKAFSGKFSPRDQGVLERFVATEMGPGSEGERVYDRIANETQKRVQRAAAARGGFASGASMRQEGEALADLGARRYEQLADLAERGQRMELDRLGLGFGFERDIDRAGLDKLGLGVDVRKAGIGAATAADETRAGLARSADDTRTSRMSALDSLAAATSSAERENRRDVDRLYTTLSEREAQREQIESEVAGRQDDLRSVERRALDTLAGEAGRQGLDREGLRVKVAEGASGEERDRRAGDIRIAEGEDRFSTTESDRLADLAKGASEETRTSLKQIADLYLGLADRESGIESDYERMGMAGDTALAMEQIQILLDKGKIDAATAQAFVTNLLEAGSAGLKYAGGRA